MSSVRSTFRLYLYERMLRLYPERKISINVNVNENTSKLTDNINPKSAWYLMYVSLNVTDL